MKEDAKFYGFKDSQKESPVFASEKNRKKKVKEAEIITRRKKIKTYYRKNFPF